MSKTSRRSGQRGVGAGSRRRRPLPAAEAEGEAAAAAAETAPLVFAPPDPPAPPAPALAARRVTPWSSSASPGAGPIDSRNSRSAGFDRKRQSGGGEGLLALAPSRARSDGSRLGVRCVTISSPGKRPPLASSRAATDVSAQDSSGTSTSAKEGEEGLPVLTR